MPNTGNLFPATAQDIARGSAAGTWSTPANVLTDNTVDTICVASGGGASAGSHYLVCRNFGLALVSSAAVSGITIRAEVSEHSSGTESLNAQLQNDSGVLIGTPKALTISGTGKAIYTYGGIADLWGATLTPGIVNHANFGVRLWFTTAHEIRIDYVTVAAQWVGAPVTVALSGVPLSGDVGAIVYEGVVAPPGGVFPGPIFPGPIFPGPIFPGGGPAGIVDISAVTATAEVGTLVAVLPNPPVVVALTGVDMRAGSGVGSGSSGPVFPDGVFPGDVFPGPIFPSGGGIIDESGGVGYVLPRTIKSLTSSETGVQLGFLSVEPERVGELSTVLVTVEVGSVVQAHVLALTSDTAEATVETVVAVSDTALTGVLTGFSIYFVGPEVEVGLSGVGVTAEVATLSVGEDRIGLLTGVYATAAIEAVGPDLEASLSGVTATVSPLTSFGFVLTLTGVSATAQAGTVENEFHKTLGAVTIAVRVGHTPKEGDVILDLAGATASVGSVGILGVGPQLPTSPYRHIAPAPIPRRPFKELEQLEREMELMEK